MAAVARRGLSASPFTPPALLLLATLLLLLTNRVSAQPNFLLPPSNLKRCRVAILPYPQTISSLPILPNSLRLNGDTTSLAWHLDSTLTSIAFVAPRIRHGDTISISFRTIDLQLHASYPAKRLLELLSPDSTLAPLLPKTVPAHVAAPLPPITIRGIAERTVGMGSQTYAAPSSSTINLSIYGPLYRSARFEAHIADNSLPFQPDGTSARIDNINMLFLRVYDTAWRIEAGDIRLEESHGSFLRQREEIKGIGGEWKGEWRGRDSLAINMAIGTGKGEIERAAIDAMEGIQGPYTLFGNHDFAQIVVQAGSERVYLDGELLVRGNENDYTIDYNLGSVTFTPKRPINSRSRIVVEYETTKRTYTRMLGNVSASAQNHQGWQIHFKGYIAHDRLASLPPELNGETTLETLRNIQEANKGTPIIPRLEKVGGRMQSGYLQVDTTVHGLPFTIFRYSPAGIHDSLLALPFAYVGANRGDYILTQGAYNGRVYQWVAPSNGTPQGEYAPGIRLSPPAHHTMLEANITKRWKNIPADVSLSTAYTDANANSLTNIHRHHSYAIEVMQNARIAAYGDDGLYIHTRGRWVSKNFAPVSRFLPLEFHRNWGERAAEVGDPWADAAVSLTSRSVNAQASLKGEMLWRPNSTAWRAAAQCALHASGWEFSLNASTLVRRSDSSQITRGAIATSIARPLAKIRVEGNARSEWLIPTRRLLLTQLLPYAYAEGGINISLIDTLAVKASIQSAYRHTWDTALFVTLKPHHHAIENILNASIPIGKSGSLTGTASSRVTFNHASPQHEKPNLTILSSINYIQSVARQRIHYNALLSLSSELLPKWQFHYIPVPIGQGTHAWIDGNGDGKPQLDEFFPAQHADQALFIKQMVASSEQQKVLSANASFTLSLSPRQDNLPIDSSSRWWQRFDLTATLEHNAKRTDKHLEQLLNPFATIDYAVIPERFRSATLTASINRNATPLSLTYSLTLSDSWQTIAQGIATATAKHHQLTLETPQRQGFNFNVLGKRSKQRQARPYALHALEELTLWQIGGSVLWRGKQAQTHEVSAAHSWITLQPKHLRVRSQKYAYRMDIPFSTKWKGTTIFTYCLVNGDAIGLHALAYQTLQGNTNGHNFDLTATLTYKISAFLEVNCTYSLRKNGNLPTSNSGFATLRASF